MDSPVNLHSTGTAGAQAGEGFASTIHDGWSAGRLGVKETV